MATTSKGGSTTRRTTVRTFAEKRARREPLVVVTAYDFPQALAVDAAGVDAVLVGDSLAMTVLGRSDTHTLAATMDEMIHHTKAVSRGAARAMVVGDMPFMSYQSGPRETLKNASRFLREGGAQAVKLEWGVDSLAATRLLVGNGIPVMGHLGFTPQHLHRFGGYRVQGKDRGSAARMVRDAKALEKAGAFAIVLELVPAELARKVTRAVKVPTIGIGAGPHCSGQVQVLHDLAGMNPGFRPRHAKAYADLHGALRAAVARYASEVRGGVFPPS
jgi:3-methyl-2-oxobutanoate hydroxymethyltransferase